ncbi:MAG: hypothetical protein M3237_22555 [Actinomycetota bacterium]|nr:hypothetical protein [Actinomycetota bacterium]
MRPPRPLLALPAATLCAAVAWLAVVVNPTAQPRSEEASARSDHGPALAALRAWDAGRARAWASGDVTALRSLYTRSSAAGERDASMLRRWWGRGLRVAGMETQVLAARVVDHSDDRLVLVVTDRLARAVAIGQGRRVVLPSDGATTRTVTLRLVDGVWRVASVLPALVGTQRSAEASTASTSRSRNR